MDEMLIMIFPLDFPYFEQAAFLFIRVVKWGLDQRFSGTSLILIAFPH